MNDQDRDDGNSHRHETPRAREPHGPELHPGHKRPRLPQMDVPTANLPGEAHFPLYGYGLPPYPYGHYPPHPYLYGGYEPPYRAMERTARRSRSPSPIRNCSKSIGKPDAQGEHGIKRTLVVGLDVDPHTPIPMTPITAGCSRSPSPSPSCSKSTANPCAHGAHGIKRTLFVGLDVEPHPPIPMNPIQAATGLAEEDDVPISHPLRHQTPVELPPDNAPTIGTSMPPPSPAIGQREAATMSTKSEQCHSCGGPVPSSWRSHVDRLLSLIVERVTGVEDILGTVLGGVADLGAQLEDMGHRLSQMEVGVQTWHKNEDMKEEHVDVATFSPSNKQHGRGESPIGELPADGGSPTGPQNLSVQHTGEPRGSGLGHPTMVDDDQSSHSGHGEAAVGMRVRVRDSAIAARVHTNPRMRVVPFAQRILGLQSPARGGTATAENSPKLTPIASKYKNPPGYENVADFGSAMEPEFTPPPLAAKENWASPPAWHKVLGLAPMIQQCRCG